jgi:hypothetical protein
MKRTLVYLALLVVLLLVFLATYYAKDSYELIPVNTTLNEEPLPLSESWFNYDSPGGEFSVSLPLLPQTATQNLTDPKTDEVKRYEMYVAQTEGDTIYMISLISLSQEPEDAAKILILNQMMNDMVAANPGNKLASSKSTSYEGLPSLDFTIENDHNTIQAREFIKGKTIYLLSTILKKDKKEKSHFQHFINSFKMKSS